MTTTRSGRLVDLRGELVSFTGWLSQPRADYVRQIRRRGGRHQRHVSQAITVLVQGTPNAQYKWVNFGTKLREIAYFQECGERIYVIREEELIRLLDGEPLTAAESKSARRTAASPFGVTFRRASTRRTDRALAAARLVTIDLDELERRTLAHHRLVNQLADLIENMGRQPLSPSRSDCQFDVGFEVGSTFHVIEVKTTSRGNEVQQMRLGLGQVLHYRHHLLSGYDRVTAHLVLSAEPSLAYDMADVCEAHRVRVSWAPDFDGLFG